MDLEHVLSPSVQEAFVKDFVAAFDGAVYTLAETIRIGCI